MGLGAGPAAGHRQPPAHGVCTFGAVSRVRSSVWWPWTPGKEPVSPRGLARVPRQALARPGSPDSSADPEVLVATVGCLGPCTGLEDDPQAVLQTIRRYVHVFFGCKECGEHFEEMAKESIDSVKTPDQAILWLWKKHNLVNSRLAGEQKPLGGQACAGPDVGGGGCLPAGPRPGRLCGSGVSLLVTLPAAGRPQPSPAPVPSSRPRPSQTLSRCRAPSCVDVDVPLPWGAC